jgi:hypothetical protein
MKIIILLGVSRIFGLLFSQDPELIISIKTKERIPAFSGI